MEFLKDFFTNYVLMSAIIAWFLAQLIKVVIALFTKDERSVPKILFSTGGMPSSHSSSVCALCISCGIMPGGLASPAFAISLVLAGIVMTDARGVRYEAGKQAAIINRITKELFAGNSDEVNTGLKELIGHTPFQVFMGALLGIAVSVGMAFVLGPWA
jgi:acid phosphatase family membrane protein YuiD